MFYTRVTTPADIQLFSPTKLPIPVSKCPNMKTITVASHY